MGRSGLGCDFVSTSIPKSAAIAGSSEPTRFTVASSSSLTWAGFSVGCTWLRIGLNANASRTGDPAVGHASAVRLLVEAAASLAASSAGKRTPAFGGCAELERTHDAADADGSVDVAEPQVQLLLLLGDERFLQGCGNRTRVVS